MKKFILTTLLILSVNLFAEKNPGVGLVKRVTVSFPGEEIMAAKVDEKSEAMVRILNKKKTADGFTYDIEFIGLEPGTYNLVKYLRSAVTGEPLNLPEYSVEVDTVLNKDFQGELVDFQKSVETLTPWYKKLNYLIIGFWVILLPAIIFLGRKKQVVEEIIEVKEKSLNEKIQELLTTLKGKSSKEIWQKIEGLIFQHWCKEKNLGNMPMHEAMVKLKADSEAGPFILKLEQGLHSKSLKNEQEVTDLIQNLVKENQAL